MTNSSHLFLGLLGNKIYVWYINKKIDQGDHLSRKRNLDAFSVVVSPFIMIASIALVSSFNPYFFGKFKASYSLLSMLSQFKGEFYFVIWFYVIAYLPQTIFFVKDRYDLKKVLKSLEGEEQTN